MTDAEIAQFLDGLRTRVRNNVPHHGRPERFHEEKSDIVSCLATVIEILRQRARP